VLRSYLYVPGDRPERVAKACALCEAGGDDAPDALIIDLEDAVAPSRKDEALANITDLLGRRPACGEAQLVVRINGGNRGRADAEALAPLGPDAFYLAKAEAGAMIDTGGVPLVMLVETALGLRDIDIVAARPGVRNLAIGEADLTAELGIAPGTEHALWPLRMRVVVASAAAKLDPPTAPVYTDVRDLDGLHATSVALRAAGFGARAAIHPAQVATINRVFRPSADGVAEAAALVAAYDAAMANGVGVYIDANGKMVDEAIVRAARRLIPHQPSPTIGYGARP
jgi:citrate lyase subunit beta / citryl-CoA lyase